MPSDSHDPTIIVPIDSGSSGLVSGSAIDSPPDDAPPIGVTNAGQPVTRIDDGGPPQSGIEFSTDQSLLVPQVTSGPGVASGPGATRRPNADGSGGDGTQPSDAPRLTINATDRYDGSGRADPAAPFSSGDRTDRADRASRPGSRDPDDPATWPAIPGYRLERVLGSGGFGSVFLATDNTLGREVAIKIPLPERMARDDFIDLFLSEAQALAGIDHPNVLPIYQCGRTDDGVVYAVSKYVDGSTLAEALGDPARTLAGNIGLLAIVLDALAMIHEQGVVHRDIKPQNILIDAAGTPYVADFGLALREDRIDSLRQVGTLRYMSPEQCRGESHLVDGRADVYAVGVILYGLLTGRFPFGSDRTQDLVDRILRGNPRPPRQIDRTISRTLERICLKALSTRATDRFTTAYDFADELRTWLHSAENDTRVEAASTTRYDSQLFGGPASELASALGPSVLGQAGGISSGRQIVPRGLRAFGQKDARFYLRLVPGPRAVGGLPDLVEHWKDWIEAGSDEPTARVGVMYGPSGCGKSSLLQAGVLPQLDRSVSVICIRATPGETENSLRTALRQVLATTIGDRDLADVAADIRLGRGLSGERQVVLVIDQLEQWLASHRLVERSELAGVLRQCDGKRLKALLLVRDEFWLPLSRLLKVIEVPLQSGANAVVVDLFDKRHARRVLHGFGVGYGRLPEDEDALSPEQARFLDDAVDALATDEAVYPVRLAVLAEMMKTRDWTQSELRAGGGVGAIGVRFLEETFSSETSTERHRMHADAAARVLSKLLPSAQSEIRGHSPTVSELRAASGYHDRPEAFAELLTILESELRLISVAREIIRSGDIDHETHEIPRLDADTKYHLAHEFLIRPVREWLSRRQRNSFRGRAMLAYETCLSDWRTHRSTKFLPWLTDWVRFHTLLRPGTMSDDGRAMMRQANRYFGLRLLLAGLLAAVGFGLVRFVERSAAIANQTRLLQTASVERLPDLLAAPFEAPAEVAERLGGWLATDEAAGVDPLVPLTAMQAYGRPHADWVGQMLAATPRERALIAGISRLDSDAVAAAFGPIAIDPERPAAERMAAAQVALSVSQTPDPAVLDSLAADAGVARELLAGRRFIDELKTAFEPVKRPLLDQFARIVPSRARTPESVAAADYLLAWASDDAELTFERLYDPLDWQEAEFRPLVAKHAQANTARMQALVAEVAEAARTGQTIPGNRTDAQFRRAGWSLALLLGRLGPDDLEVDLFDRLQHGPEPGLRVELIHRLPQTGIAPATIAGWLDQAARIPDPAAIAGLLMMLAEVDDPDDELVEAAVRQIRASDDAEVHAAAEVCLRRWGRLRPDHLRTNQPLDSDERTWRLNALRYTMVRVPGERIAARDAAYRDRGRLAGFDLEVAAEEIRVRDYIRFAPGDYIHFDESPTDDHPANVITFIEAVNLCRWLTEQDGMGEDSQCYPPATEPLPDSWAPYPNHRQRDGYRLPTLAEWQAVTGGYAGRTLPFPTGRSERRLVDYETYSERGNRQNGLPHQGLPNPFGLFHLAGNVMEWTIDTKDRQRIVVGGPLIYDDPPWSIVDRSSATSPETRWNAIGMRVYRSIPRK